MPESRESSIALLRSWLNESQTIAVLSGAGMSTDSGIPDFRSENGVWQDEELLSAMTEWYLLYKPEDFWTKFKQVFLREELLSALPNAGHLALALLENTGKQVRVFTQNVDGLHQSAGSSQVFELHGTAKAAVCPVCYQHYGLDHILSEPVPRCTWVNAKGALCDTILHPETVLFGQEVRHLPKATEAVLSCDLLLVLGTSLTVAPVSELPALTRAGHAKLVIINLEPTHLDKAASLVIHDRIAPILTDVVSHL